MQIKRNYQEPFFRPRRKRHFVRNFFVALLLVGAAVAFVLSQPELVVSTAMTILGPETTPTPLPADLATAALDFYRTGQLEEAAALLQQASTQSPDNVDYLYEYGMILIDLDEPEPAEELGRQILSLDPNDPRGYALRARAMVWQGNTNAALPVALAGIDINPGFAPLHAAVSRAFTAEGRLREAQESGLRAIELAPGDVRSYWAYAFALANSGARDEAIVELERAIEAHRTFLPPYFELAILYLAANRDQEAIDTYSAILGMEPRNARALLRQCLAYRKTGQFERALGLCQDAVTSDPELVEAQFWLGALLYNEFDFAGAQRAFEACTDIDPANLECHYRLGLSYYYISRDTYRESCADSREVLSCEAYEECATAWQLLQDSLLMAQGRDNTEEDIDIIREGLAAISSDAACAGVSGLPTPTPAPEATTEPESTADPAAQA